MVMVLTHLSPVTHTRIGEQFNTNSGEGIDHNRPQVITPTHVVLLSKYNLLNEISVSLSEQIQLKILSEITTIYQPFCVDLYDLISAEIFLVHCVLRLP